MINLTLRPLALGDTDDLHVIAGQWAVVRQLGGWPWPANRAFTATRSVPYAGQGFVWGIETDGKIIGSVAVTRGELGYMIHQDYWRRGIGRTVVAAALDHAFDHDDCPVINASVWADNVGSARLLQSFGFTHWHSRFEQAIARGYPVMSHYYRLTRAARDGLRNTAKSRNSDT
ncbi:GNAT family N-acetyltransferase [Loktanella sp. R86503]|uniref:GNAT family N-acetyltransferase n=1 Tax=Loktanella sp. R86503 TaxID=3093847 RepID=UPI0036D97A9C